MRSRYGTGPGAGIKATAKLLVSGVGTSLGAKLIADREFRHISVITAEARRWLIVSCRRKIV
ncbi:hypothetical protein SPHV1_2310085 [Novosphingobium sp. KN65.2]|nr:hypothetical protein SPHV1_2310085 [Novosphingobium sp. KN65.2]